MSAIHLEKLTSKKQRYYHKSRYPNPHKTNLPKEEVKTAPKKCYKKQRLTVFTAHLKTNMLTDQSPVKEGQKPMANIALLGCGMWGRNIARNLSSLSVLSAVCDSDDARAASFADQFDTDARSFDDILDDETINGVMLATVAHSHKDLAIKALQAGKHVYIEKPMALTFADANAIHETALETGNHVMVGHLIRYHPAFIALQQQIASGAIGKVRHIGANRLAMGRIRNTESVLFDLCPHDLSLILALADDEPQTVICHGVSHITKGVVDILSTGLGFKGGLSANMQTSWLSPYKEHRLTVTGETGSLVFDDTKPWNEKLVLCQDSITQAGSLFVIERASPLALPVPESEPLKDEMRAFIALCDEAIMPPTDSAEALRVQKVLEEMQKQLVDFNG